MVGAVDHVVGKAGAVGVTKAVGAEWKVVVSEPID
jgi:hypothetical protein